MHMGVRRGRQEGALAPPGPLPPWMAKIKALQNWKISVKALSKQLRKLTINTKQIIAIIIISFVNVNIND